MVQAGEPLNNVRDILGHKSLGMTLRYAHLAPRHQESAMKAMDALALGSGKRSAATVETRS